MDKRKELNKLVKDSIAESILLLMKEKQFSEITITEIVTKAGVARASFYRNFSFKEDALTYYLVQIMNDYRNNVTTKKEMKEYSTIYATMKFATHYKWFLKILIKSNISSLLLDAINTYLFEAYDVNDENIELKYKLYSYGGSIFNVMLQWVNSGSKESLEVLTNAICK